MLLRSPMGEPDEFKPSTRGWGRLPAEEVESLANIMKQEMEQAHLLDNAGQHAEIASIIDPVSLTGSPSNDDCTDDLMIAILLQHELDRESDTLLKLGEEKYNKCDKVALSFENYKAVPDVESDSSGPDDDNLEYQNYQIDRNYKKPCFGASGVIFKDGKYVSKHDKVLCGRNNTLKVFDFPPEFRTGDAVKMDVQLSNQVFNRLKQHSIAAVKRQHLRHEKKEKSTAEQAVDTSTSLELYKLINTNYLKDVHGVVATGKEAVVFHSILAEYVHFIESENEGEHVAVKIYKTTLNEFKNRAQYVKSDKHLNKSRQALEVWAQREYLHLKRFVQAGIMCPKPLKVRAHLLVMDFIGDADGRPAPQLKDLTLTHKEWHAAYRQVERAMEIMYQKCELVHADLSEFNLLYWQDKVWVIDVAQAVHVDHSDCLTFLARDCTNIAEFFGRKGLKKIKARKLFNLITGFKLASDETFDSDVNDLVSRMQDGRTAVYYKNRAGYALELEKICAPDDSNA
ncbi:serine:threonine protein kinase RIO3 [Trichuris trichiura]|uniref:Serine/threonine-protein kinase RIO3 n=1 Tax=Trichuris trichiura TaxID=36087 RepID=A0A077Z9Z0_TRITR|nr:serine:threonine protein kinase RIO3 [Trichuris trichiura]